MLLFTVGMAMVAAVFFGLAPALQIARQRQRKTMARQMLVAAQVAASCVLLIVAGLLVRATHARALYSDPGFGYQQLLSMDPQLGQHSYSPRGRESLSGPDAGAGFERLPGVISVSLVKLPPMGHTVDRERIGDQRTQGADLSQLG